MDGRVISDWVRMRGIHRESCKISKRIKRNLASKYKYFIRSKSEFIKNFTLIKMSNNILRYNSEKSLGKNTKNIYIYNTSLWRSLISVFLRIPCGLAQHTFLTLNIYKETHTHTHTGRKEGIRSGSNSQRQAWRSYSSRRERYCLTHISYCALHNRQYR